MLLLQGARTNLPPGIRYYQLVAAPSSSFLRKKPETFFTVLGNSQMDAVLQRHDIRIGCATKVVFEYNAADGSSSFLRKQETIFSTLGNLQMDGRFVAVVLKKVFYRYGITACSTECFYGPEATTGMLFLQGARTLLPI